MSDSKSHAVGEPEDYFRLLISGMREYAIYMLDPDGRILTWNPGAERLKGYRESEILGSSFERFFTAEDIERKVPARILEDARRRGEHRDPVSAWRS